MLSGYVSTKSRTEKIKNDNFCKWLCGDAVTTIYTKVAEARLEWERNYLNDNGYSFVPCCLFFQEYDEYIALNDEIIRSEQARIQGWVIEELPDRRIFINKEKKTFFEIPFNVSFWAFYFSPRYENYINLVKFSHRGTREFFRI